MPCAVIQVLHPMVGIDIHAEITPPGAPPIPVPFPYVPHAVACPLGGNVIVAGLLGLIGVGPTVKCSSAPKPVLVNFVKMPVILQGSDIGMGIPHIPMVPCTPFPNLPLIILGSGSATEFCAFSVKAHGKAIANAPAVFVSMNVNCGFPPTPGIVIAPSLVFTGFRIGDFIAGMVGLLMDAALSAAISIVFNGIPTGNNEGARVLFGGGLAGLVKSRIGATLVGRILTNPLAQPLIGSFVGLGSPLGYSNEHTTLLGGGYGGHAGSGWGSLKENTQNAVADYFTAP